MHRSRDSDYHRRMHVAIDDQFYDRWIVAIENRLTENSLRNFALRFGTVYL
jgi:hypothetical protein